VVGRIVPIHFELSYGGMTRAELDSAIYWLYYPEKNAQVTLLSGNQIINSWTDLNNLKKSNLI